MDLRIKRHFHLIVLLALVAGLLVLGLGDQRIVAYTVAGGEQVQQSVQLAQAEMSGLLVAVGIR
ncbi:MAG: hypothetical protein HY782_19825 [Chloroflexi bacterium]|nr:hypothetical protein [Chloroflexota bacterium]